MSQTELIKAVPNLVGDITKEGEGHFYYSVDNKEGKKRRSKLALELYKKGLR